MKYTSTAPISAVSASIRSRSTRSQRAMNPKNHTRNTASVASMIASAAVNVVPPRSNVTCDANWIVPHSTSTPAAVAT